MSDSFTVTVIEGEDSAPEAMRPTVALLGRLVPSIEWVYPLVGQVARAERGTAFPPESRAQIDAADATLFGASSGATVEVLFHLRWGRRTYANVRPVTSFPGPGARPGPYANEDIDLVIVRENLEDLYALCEGDLGTLPNTYREPVTGTPYAQRAPGRYAVKVATERGTELVARRAFETAQARAATRDRPATVTCATKYNLLQTDAFFRDVARAVASDFADVRFETFIIDDFAHRLVLRPQDFDVVLLPNLYGDILSDAAAALIGGMGLAPSGCYGDDFAYFEPAHGTAPDLAGTGTINPTATLLSGALLLEHLGLAEPATRLREAIAAAYRDGRVLTPDQGGRATTARFCDAVEQHAARPAIAGSPGR